MVDLIIILIILQEKKIDNAFFSLLSALKNHTPLITSFNENKLNLCRNKTV